MKSNPTKARKRVEATETEENFLSMSTAPPLLSFAVRMTMPLPDGTEAGLKLGLSAPVASETTRWILAPASWAWAEPSWVSRISPFSSSRSSIFLGFWVGALIEERKT
ncbi:hypothetical protein FF2_021871 [Malus domestica]